MAVSKELREKLMARRREMLPDEYKTEAKSVQPVPKSGQSEPGKAVDSTAAGVVQPAPVTAPSMVAKEEPVKK